MKFKIQDEPLGDSNTEGSKCSLLIGLKETINQVHI